MDHVFKIVLSIDSDGTPSQDLEAILGLQPDEYWDTGSAYFIGGKEKRNRFNRWAIIEGVNELYELCEGLSRIRTRVETIRSGFASLPADAVIALNVFITTEQSVLGIGMDAEQLRYWASLGAGIHVSLVVGSLSPP